MNGKFIGQVPTDNFVESETAFLFVLPTAPAGAQVVQVPMHFEIGRGLHFSSNGNLSSALASHSYEHVGLTTT